MEKTIYHKTLIIGASVSAAPADRNPSKLFLDSRKGLQNCVSHAFSGMPGASVLSRLRKSFFDGVTSVIALDLMFWDSVIGLADPRQSQAYLRGLFNELIDRKIPILIGNVPGFHDLQIHRMAMNEAVEREVARHEGARLIHLDRLYDSVAIKSGIEFEGRLWRLSELLPDGLHPSPIGAKILAREIERAAHGESAGAESIVV